MSYRSINPATGEELAEYDILSPAGATELVTRVRAAFLEWRELSIAQRIPYFKRLAGVLRRNSDRWGRLITLEMGKPIGEARAEVEKCAWLAEVYAENAERWLAEEEMTADGRSHRVVYQPLGVILSIMPWNFPFWQALRFGVPALMAGNTSVLKHASNVPQCALAIEEAFREAGFPDNTFRTALVNHQGVETILGLEAVQGVSLTGSTAAGSRVAALAGEHLRKIVLELGGSDPFIVLDDADVEFTAAQAVRGRTLNTGQSCIAAKRFIVHKAVAESFIQRFAELMSRLRIGDPLDEATQIGPLVNAAAVEELEGQLAQSVGLGARVVTGGHRPDRSGSFFEPTVVVDVRPGMRVMDEEVFGPIAPVVVVDDDETAIRTANATPFGLGGSVWTPDLRRGEQLARRIDAGSVFVNSIVKSDPRMPFGGIKGSGFGRELSWFGLREFVNIKGLNVYEHGNRE